MARKHYLIFVLCFFSACNVFSTLDKPATKSEVYSLGLSKGDAKDCTAALNELLSIVDPDDSVYEALGWAYLCLIGAPPEAIATTLYQYSSTSADLTVIGILARSLVPIDGTKNAYLDRAQEAFNAMSESKVKSLQLGIHGLVKAASILATQAGNSPSSNSLTRQDIDVGCTSTCSTCANPGIPDNTVTNFSTTISNSALSLSAAGATNLQVLASSIRSGTNSSQASARCFIFSRLIPLL